MSKIDNGIIDEAMFLDAVSKESDQLLIVKEQKTKVEISESESKVKRRRVTLPGFEEGFMNDRDISRRCAVYVTPEYRDKLMRVANSIGYRRVSVSGYIENIIRHHFEIYGEEINELYARLQSEKLI